MCGHRRPAPPLPPGPAPRPRPPRQVTARKQPRRVRGARRRPRGAGRSCTASASSRPPARPSWLTPEARRRRPPGDRRVSRPAALSGRSRGRAGPRRLPMEQAGRGCDGAPRGPVLHIVVVGFHHKKGCQVSEGPDPPAGRASPRPPRPGPPPPSSSPPAGSPRCSPAHTPRPPAPTTAFGSGGAGCRRPGSRAFGCLGGVGGGGSRRPAPRFPRPSPPPSAFWGPPTRGAFRRRQHPGRGEGREPGGGHACPSGRGARASGGCRPRFFVYLGSGPRAPRWLRPLRPGPRPGSRSSPGPRLQVRP